MKKLIAHEVVKNRLEILVDARGKTQFILARRSEQEFGDIHWQLFQGPKNLGHSAYRLDLYSKLGDFAVKCS